MNDLQRAAMQKAVDWIDWYTTPGGDSPGYSIYEVARTLREALNTRSSSTHSDAEYSEVAQPQGSWVDLTDDEIKTAYESWWETHDNHAFPIWVGAKAAIAKFKSKNTPPVVPQGEPVAWALSHSMGLEFGSKYPIQETKEAAEQMARQHMGAVVVTPLYAAPVRTKDLTGDELSDLAFDYEPCENPFKFARAVIAADRAKNLCERTK